MDVLTQSLLTDRKMGGYDRLSKAVKKATGYRTVVRLITEFADNEILHLHPDLSRQERIIMAQTEPYWSASKELRYLTPDEKATLKLTEYKRPKKKR